MTTYQLFASACNCDGLSLCRRVPNLPLDQRFMMHRYDDGRQQQCRRQKSLTDVDTAWVYPSPVATCAVWWGRVASDPEYSSHSLIVVTDIAKKGGSDLFTSSQANSGLSVMR